MLLHQIFTLGLQLVMLATSSFIIGTCSAHLPPPRLALLRLTSVSFCLLYCVCRTANASDALTLTSQFVAVQLIAQIDVVFARVLQIRDPAPDFFQSRLSGARCGSGNTALGPWRVAWGELRAFSKQGLLRDRCQ